MKSWETFENELWEQGASFLAQLLPCADLALALAGSNQSIGELAASRRDEAGDSRYGGSQFGGAFARSEGGMASPRESLVAPQYPTQQRGSYAGSLNTLGQFGGEGGSVYGHQQQGHQSMSQSAFGSGYFGGEHQRSGSNPTLNDFGGNRPISAMPTPLGVQLGYLPTEEVIVADVHASASPCALPLRNCPLTRLAPVLASADLTTLTKKGVRNDLEGLCASPRLAGRWADADEPSCCTDGVELSGATKTLVNRQIELALGLA